MAKRSHIGEKRSQDAILTEVLEELREMERYEGSPPGFAHF